VQQEEAKKEVKQEVSNDEMARKDYMEELTNAKLKDVSLHQNLKYMMDMGYLNYSINYNLLTRNGNDLVVAINKLCNNIVSDSMFIQ